MRSVSLVLAATLALWSCFTGYGWGINDDGIFTHSGSTGTFAWGDPQRRVIVVALTQTPGATELRPQLMKILNGGT